MSIACNMSPVHSRASSKAIELGFVCAEQFGREVCERRLQISIQFGAFLFEIEKFIAIYPVEVTALRRGQFIGLAHVQRNPAQPERMPNYRKCSHPLDWQATYDHRHRGKVRADVGVQNWVARRIYLKASKDTHLSNLTSSIAEGQEAGGILLMAPHSFQVQCTLVLGVDGKACHRHGHDRANTSRPGRPVTAGYRRYGNEFGKKISDAKAGQGGGQHASCMLPQDSQYSHQEIIA